MHPTGGRCIPTHGTRMFELVSRSFAPSLRDSRTDASLFRLADGRQVIAEFPPTNRIEAKAGLDWQRERRIWYNPESWSIGK